MNQIFHNHWLKVAALGIGSLIWLHVVTEKLYTFDLKLPLKQVTLRSNLVLATLPPGAIFAEVAVCLFPTPPPELNREEEWQEPNCS